MREYKKLSLETIGSASSQKKESLQHGALPHLKQ